ncbi:LuxR C-terminal-related transcriptional regulator [Conexibacter woesei]|uniref:Transcriptional regulator, LuxR family n=1 Tax=Conexibacter woesei (strain DSM 14684 / CCUG 47730 / CIP 108061 / JCM 11494 / NBRC 100937 / ID131577) TaxID=469383 RepID=D3F3F2_CONWI|nr:LuxR C-terminal-related transcriptional regulator [Conexibacter woesei]ADB52317.1 transcriptional regulator, LuxR family [Conexibacter woesei DSM 14684]
MRWSADAPTVDEAVAWVLARPDREPLRQDASGLLEEAPTLVTYAHAALELELDDVSFLWESPRLGLLQVWIEPVRVPSGDEWGRELTAAPARNEFGLTRRELHVLTLLAGGSSNGEIAAQLGTAPRTIGAHVARLLEKLDQSSRSGAAAVAVERGLLWMPLPATTGTLMGLSVGKLDLAVARGLAPGSAGRRPSARRRPTRAPILLGLVVPEDNATGDGDDMQKGAALAINELNRRQVAGRRIQQVVVRADVDSHASMAAAFDELSRADVDAITFGYIGNRAVIPDLVAHAASFEFPVLHASTSALAEAVVRANPTEMGSVFQVCGSELSYGDGFVRFIDEIRERRLWTPPNRRIAIVEPIAPMVVMSDESLEAAERGGWRLQRVERDPDPSADAADVVDRIEAIEPAVVLLPTFRDDQLLIDVLRGLRARALTPLVYAIYTPSMPGFLERAGSLAEGVLWATVTGQYGDAFGLEFERRFRATYGRSPGRSQAGVHYDIVHVLALAWDGVGHPKGYSEVCQALRRVVHRGVNGAYWLGAPGQTGLTYPDATPDPSIGQAHLVLQVQHGRHRIVAPDPYAESTFAVSAPVSAS